MWTVISLNSLHAELCSLICRFVPLHAWKHVWRKVSSIPAHILSCFTLIFFFFHSFHPFLSLLPSVWFQFFVVHRFEISYWPVWFRFLTSFFFLRFSHSLSTLIHLVSIFSLRITLLGFVFQSISIFVLSCFYLLSFSFLLHFSLFFIFTSSFLYFVSPFPLFFLFFFIFFFLSSLTFFFFSFCATVFIFASLVSTFSPFLSFFPVFSFSFHLCFVLFPFRSLPVSPPSLPVSDLLNCPIYFQHIIFLSFFSLSCSSSPLHHLWSLIYSTVHLIFYTPFPLPLLHFHCLSYSPTFQHFFHTFLPSFHSVPSFLPCHFLQYLTDPSISHSLPSFISFHFSLLLLLLNLFVLFNLFPLFSSRSRFGFYWYCFFMFSVLVLFSFCSHFFTEFIVFSLY